MLIFLFAILASVQMINGGLVPAVLNTVTNAVNGIVGPSPGAPSPGGKPYYGYDRDHYYGTRYPYSDYDSYYSYPYSYSDYYPYDSYYDYSYPYSYTSYPYYSYGYDGYGYGYPNAPGGKGGKPGMGKPGGQRPGGRGPGGHGPGERRPEQRRPGVRRPRPAAGMEAGAPTPTTIIVKSGSRNHGPIRSKDGSTLLNLNL